MKKINTEIQHVTQPNANIFTELGFTSADAENYQAESSKLINDAKALKEQLFSLNERNDPRSIRTMQAVSAKT